jgi:hypothetical protein
MPTPEYVMVNRLGPMRASHRSDYVVYDPRAALKMTPSTARSEADGSRSTSRPKAERVSLTAGTSSQPAL